MKKIVIILLCIILTGCKSTYIIDFSDKIDTKINFSFSNREYKDYTKTDTKNVSEEVKARISEMRPLKNSYSQMFNEISYSDENYSIKGEYQYEYTYSNFKDNNVLNSCFDYSVIVEDSSKLYISLKGDSTCSNTKILVKANNRMLNNNSEKKEGDYYIWNIKDKNNEIRFNISKTEKKMGPVSAKDVVYIILIILGVAGIIIYKKRANSN